MNCERWIVFAALVAACGTNTLDGPTEVVSDAGGDAGELRCLEPGDCAAYGYGHVDDACEAGVCVPFVCTDDASCQQRGPSHANQICEQGACLAPECTSAEECQAASPTAECEAGRCQDLAWGCLHGEPPPDAPAELAFSFQVDGVNGGTPEGVQALVCRTSPRGCAAPVAGPFEADADGVVSFTLRDVLHSGFDGYVRFTSPGALPLELRFARPVRRDVVSGDVGPLMLLPIGTIDSFGALLGQEIDEASTALLSGKFFDCQGHPAAGLRLGSDTAPSEVFFAADDTLLPDVNAEATSETGVAGLANLPDGIHIISVTHRASGEELYDFPLVAEPATSIVVYAHASDLREP